MNLVKLEHFVAVCEYQNISRAAEALYISQPALSMSISAVEKYFGHPLFERKNKKIYLNKEGEIALKHARDILKRFEFMKNDIEKSVASDRVLRLSTEDVSLYSFISARFADEIPGFDIKNVVPEDDMKEALKNHDTDILLTTADLSDSQVESDFMFQEYSYVLVPSDSDFYGRKEADLREFEGLPFIRNKDLLDTQPFFLSGRRQKEFIEKEHIALQLTYLDYSVFPALWTTSRHYFFLSTQGIFLNPLPKALDPARIVRLTNPELSCGFWLSCLKEPSFPAGQFFQWYKASRHTLLPALNPS